MYVRSLEFDELVKQSHTVITKAELIQSGSVIYEFGVIDGSVTVTRKSESRRRCEVTLLDELGTLVPTSASSLFAPFSTYLKLYRGIQHSFDELITIGTFDISRVATKETSGGVTISLTGLDLSRTIRKSPFNTIFKTGGSGIVLATSISEIIEAVDSGIIMTNLAPIATALTNGNSVQWVFNPGEDRWKACQDLAESIGAELYFEPDGRLVLKDYADAISSDVAWSYEEGEGSMLLGITEHIWDDDDQEIYNHIIVREDNPAKVFFPSKGEAKDTDPMSPTYYLGTFGDRLLEVKTPFVTTNEQAQILAETLLLQHLAWYERTNITTMVHPAHEVGDIISIRRERSGIEGIYSLEEFTIPMTAEAISTVSTKRRVF